MAVKSLSELRAHRTESPLDRLLEQPLQLNAEILHAMEARDDQLVEDSILHGAADAVFVYSFQIQGKTIEGVSVIGARELASEYGGIRSRIVSTFEKTGSVFVLKSFDPVHLQVQRVAELESEPDYYEVTLQVEDIKSGNSISIRKKEFKKEKRRDGTFYDRPHYDTIAESKAYRNGVIGIIPQRVVKEFKKRSLDAGRGVVEKRSKDDLIAGFLRFAANQSLRVDRNALNDLTYNQIMGLAESAKEDIARFKAAANSLGVLLEQGEAIPDQNEQID